MPRRPSRKRAYQELSLLQLRSFCETVRTGSLKRAAAALGLTHPTVWAQVHALERQFGLALIEPAGRGSRPTAAGRMLAELAAPLVIGMDSLLPRLQEAQRTTPVTLRLAAPPRIVLDDLPAAIREFEHRHPQVRLTIMEMRQDEVAAAVEAGRADLGLTTEREPIPPSPWLCYELCYELDIFLLTPKNHPLARRHVVRPEDLREYPLVSSRYSCGDQPHLETILEKFDVFGGPPPRVEAFFSATIREYVALGFGIALVEGLPAQPLHPHLHERSMSRYFGRDTVHAVLRRGAVDNDHARALAALVRNHNRADGGRKPRRAP
jgi:DNA-binding transcriptional LysR family regulator